MNATVNSKVCPKCKRQVAAKGDRLCTHGPGPKGEFLCPGSSDNQAIKSSPWTKGVPNER